MALRKAAKVDAIKKYGAMLGPAFIIAPTHSEAIREDIMPIRINYLDKNSALTRPADISLAMTDPILVSQASYMAYKAVSG